MMDRYQIYVYKMYRKREEQEKKRKSKEKTKVGKTSTVQYPTMPVLVKAFPSYYMGYMDVLGEDKERHARKAKGGRWKTNRFIGAELMVQPPIYQVSWNTNSWSNASKTIPSLLYMQTVQPTRWKVVLHHFSHNHKKSYKDKHNQSLHDFMSPTKQSE